jgi:hypothetical protein
VRRGKGKAAAPQFDLVTSLSKKENRMIKKHESMIQYHLARVPFYNGKDSPEMANANTLKDKIAKLEETARQRWELNH